MAKKILFAILIFIGVMAIAFFLPGYLYDRTLKVEIISETNLYREIPLNNSQLPDFKVSPGTQIEVIRTKSNQRFMAIKIRLEDGRVGWIVGDPKNMILR